MISKQWKVGRGDRPLWLIEAQSQATQIKTMERTVQAPAREALYRVCKQRRKDFTSLRGQENCSVAFGLIYVPQKGSELRWLGQRTEPQKTWGQRQGADRRYWSQRQQQYPAPMQGGSLLMSEPCHTFQFMLYIIHLYLFLDCNRNSLQELH